MYLFVLMIFLDLLGLISLKKIKNFIIFKRLCKKLKNKKDINIVKIVRIRSDYGKKFENTIFAEFRDKYNIAHEFSALKTPQQNGVVERKNRILQEIARIMLNSKKLSSRLWAEVVNTACYTINRVFFRPCTNKTSYEIWRDKKPNLSHFHVFGCTCYILNDQE